MNIMNKKYITKDILPVTAAVNDKLRFFSLIFIYLHFSLVITECLLL